MRLKLLKIQIFDKKALKIKIAKKLLNNYKKVNKILNYQGLLFLPKII